MKIDGTVESPVLLPGPSEGISPKGEAGPVVCPAADGSYKLDGDPHGTLWWAIKLCRFEYGELDQYVDSVKRLPPDAKIIAPPNAQLPPTSGPSSPDR